MALTVAVLWQHGQGRWRFDSSIGRPSGPSTRTVDNELLILQVFGEVRTAHIELHISTPCWNSYSPALDHTRIDCCMHFVQGPLLLSAAVLATAACAARGAVPARHRRRAPVLAAAQPSAPSPPARVPSARRSPKQATLRSCFCSMRRTSYGGFVGPLWSGCTVLSGWCVRDCVCGRVSAVHTSIMRAQGEVLSVCVLHV